MQRRALFKSAETGTGAIGIMIGDIAVIMGMGMGTGLITDTLIGPTPTTGLTPTTDIPIGTGDPGSASGSHSDALC